MDTQTLQRGTHIKVSTYQGVAFWYVRPCEDDTDCHLAMMVGDDRYHHVQLDDIEELHRDEFCGGCGQVGCSHNGETE